MLRISLSSLLIFSVYRFAKEHAKDSINLYHRKSLKDFMKKVAFSIDSVINDLDLAKDTVMVYWKESDS